MIGTDLFFIILILALLAAVVAFNLAISVNSVKLIADLKALRFELELMYEALDAERRSQRPSEPHPDA